MPSPRSKNSQVYVSGFSRRTNEDDLEDAFRKYGRIKDVIMKNRYAFIEFDDYRDADDAVSAMDGRSVDGHKLVVQIAGSKPSRRSKGPQPDDKCYKCGKTGHWANECREEAVPRSEKREKICYHCKQEGHIKKYCPMIDNSASERSRSSRSKSGSRSGSSSRSRSSPSPKKKHHKKSRRSHSSESRSRSRSQSKSESRSRSKDRKKSHKKSKKRSVSSSKDSKSPRSASKDKEETKPEDKGNGNKDGHKSDSE